MNHRWICFCFILSESPPVRRSWWADDEWHPGTSLAHAYLNIHSTTVKILWNSSCIPHKLCSSQYLKFHRNKETIRILIKGVRFIQALIASKPILRTRYWLIITIEDTTCLVIISPTYQLVCEHLWNTRLKEFIGCILINNECDVLLIPYVNTLPTLS